MSEHAPGTPAELLAASLVDEIPLCTGCLQPHSPYDHYCGNCGAAVGQFTAYIPFIDIQFHANTYGRLWNRVWFEPNISVASRALCLILILLLAPVMLVGLPLALGGQRADRSSETA